jgi:Tfp pilus assembly protein PilE
MQQIIELIVFIIILAAIALLSFSVYKLKIDKDKAYAKLMQALLDNSVLAEKVSSLAAEKDANALKEDDGFIKFLSNSRDWAFSYIEEVQSVVEGFRTKVDPAILKLNKTKDANVKLIIEAYKELVSILPAQESKENK